MTDPNAPAETDASATAQRAGSITVLAGPTAVGKGTVSTFVRDNYPEVSLSVSATTRAPRPGEIDGVHYHFLTHEQFDAYVKAGAFLEWATVHGLNKYGTLKHTVEAAAAAGQKVLLEIDLQGARQVREALPQAHFVFLAPPSWEELVKRLIGRGTESPEEQQRRLETAKLELAAEPEFDQTIVNEHVEAAANELVTSMGITPRSAHTEA